MSQSEVEFTESGRNGAASCQRYGIILFFAPIPKQSIIVSRELHGFLDVLETAYAGAVYLRAVDSTNGMHVSLVIAKMKVVPIKRLMIPCLEQNGAVIAVRLLHHCRNTLDTPLSATFGWMDSAIVLS